MQYPLHRSIRLRYRPQEVYSIDSHLPRPAIPFLPLLRSLIQSYQASTGRQFDEILRVIDSLQLGDASTPNLLIPLLNIELIRSLRSDKITTPANWTPGGKVIVHPSVKTEE